MNARTAPRRGAGWLNLRRGLLAGLALLSVSLGGLLGLDRAFPPPLDMARNVSVVVLDHQNRLLRPFTIKGGRWRLPITLEDVDPRFLTMLLAYEDRRFFHHAGVDPLAMMRAAGQWLVNGRIISGGSTLTMQLARLIEPRRGRSLTAKLKQVLRAFQIEARLTKRQILELYLTMAPYGGNLEGVRAASLAYFGKEPARLSVAEAALLTALPQSPEARRPDKNPRTAKAARGRVLARMAAMGIIPARDAATARLSALPEQRRDMPALAAQLARRITRDSPQENRLILNLDAPLQAALETLARQHARRLGPHISVAILVAEHASGKVMARIGAADFTDRQRAGSVDMSRAIRSPGSALKPLIYGMGFEAGLAHPETLIEDSPLDFDGYAPRNFDLVYHGPLSVRKALERSLNVPAVSMLDAVGPARFMARLERAGIKTRLPRDKTPSLAIALGGIGISLEGLVRLYGALARQGKPLDLKDRQDPAANSGAVSGKGPLLEPLASWYVSDILSGTPPPQNALKGKLAYKTGTSYGYRDAWSIGYDGRYVIGVWVGRPDGSSVPGLTGRKAAAPILFESFARVAGAAYTPLPPPPAGALQVANSGLPLTLRRFRHGRHARLIARKTPGHQLDITYPPDHAHVDLNLSSPENSVPLVVKINGGIPPYTWFANGAFIARIPHRRVLSWKPDSRGFSSLTVTDASGNSDTVSVLLE